MATSNLFKPLKIGNITLQNRLVLAPLTRYRADDNHVPLPFVAEYYAQRASVPGTLLITEATFIAPLAGGYGNIPGIYNEAQIAGWKKVTDAVHAKKSFIYLQLWALGRVAEADQLKKEFGDSAKVVSAGDIPATGHVKPTPLTEAEIKEYVSWYTQAAKNAVAAGFDGVEIHSANGYLINQFVDPASNNRADSYGGSIENRARFGVEVATAVVDAIGAERTGLRISPFSDFQEMGMKDPVPQYSYYVKELRKLKLSYIHVVDARISGSSDKEPAGSVDFVIDAWDQQSPVLVAGGFKADTAIQAVDEEFAGKDVAIVFGRWFISNPDLVFRIREGIAFTPYDRSKFYNKQQVDGYTTYPFSKEFEAQAARL